VSHIVTSSLDSLNTAPYTLHIHSFKYTQCIYSALYLHTHHIKHVSPYGFFRKVSKCIIVIVSEIFRSIV